MAAKKPSAKQVAQAAKVSAQIEALAQAAGSPEFLQLLSEIQAAPADQRTKTATELASIEQLRARGIDIPPGFRFTTRLFEDPSKATRTETLVSQDDSPAPDAIKLGPITVCASVGAIICATVGSTISQ